METVTARFGPTCRTVRVPLALPGSAATPSVGNPVVLVAETVNEYTPGQYNGVLLVSIVRVLLPAPVPPPGGVETGFGENEADAPGTKPERLRA